jgi:outer membrane protein TolC
MSRLVFTVLATAGAAFCFPGCHPQQPTFFFEDGDLSHFVDVATKIEYPDVTEAPLEEVVHTRKPLTLENADEFEMWDLSLQETVKITLANSQVIRSLGGRFASQGPATQPQTGESPNALTQQPQAVITNFDPAITESNPQTGVEAALSAFDANFTTGIVWNKNDRPQNFGRGIASEFFTPVLEQDTANFVAQVSKYTASGGQFRFTQNTSYNKSNNPSQALPSVYNVNFEAAFRQPLLQGAGTLYNRIAGPYNPQFNPNLGIGNFGNLQAGFSNTFNGVVLARINMDISLTQFQSQVRDLVQETENAYWELYFAYRNLETQKTGRDSALQTWKKINALAQVGAVGGEAEKEAQARSQYFLFRYQVENSLTQLYRAENRLRYLMGLTIADGRLIRPSTEPTAARVKFNWGDIHAEALVRTIELRAQKWRIKQREMQLIAARNQLLPRVDAIGTYRWLGLGDDLIRSDRSGLAPLAHGSDAFSVLTGGDFQEWQLGVQMTMPIGFRRQLSQVRFYQLQLARERALYKEQELEVTHQLGDAIRNLVNNYNLTQTNFNRRVAAEKEVEAVLAAYQANTVTLDTLLDAQRRRADAEIAYYRSLVDYNRGIMQVHYRKGSLLDYDGVRLAEGPWPKKAYFDALRLARQRDASLYLDYGMTLPNVISRGPINQNATQPPGETTIDELTPGELVPHEAPPQGLPQGEELPPPADQPLEAPGERLQSPLLPTGEPAAPTPLRSVRMPSDTAALRPAGPTPQAVAAGPAPTEGGGTGRDIDISVLAPVAAETSASWEGTQRDRARAGLWR